MNKIQKPTYHDRCTEICLGDRIERRIWFKKYHGTVVYVPGISPINKNLEHDGISEVGIRLDEGGFIASPLDPDGLFLLRKSTAFVGRGTIGNAKEMSDKEFSDDGNTFLWP